MIAGILFVMTIGWIEIFEPEFIYTHRQSMEDKVLKDAEKYSYSQDWIDKKMKDISDQYIF
jgi:hypothetical protein